MTISRLAIAAPLAALALSACQQEPQDAAPEEMVQATPEPATEADEIRQKSIIRTTVKEAEPTVVALEPASVTISFADKSGSLDDAARAKLEAFLAAPAVQGGGEITLRGHSDSRGHDAANLAASRRRAETVRDYLESGGVAAERMTVIALGETRPVAPNANLDGSDNPEGRAKNRRVEVTAEPPVLDEGPPAAEVPGEP